MKMRERKSERNDGSYFHGHHLNLCNNFVFNKISEEAATLVLQAKNVAKKGKEIGNARKREKEVDLILNFFDFFFQQT